MLSDCGSLQRIEFGDVPPPDRVLADFVEAGADGVDGHGGEARLAVFAPGVGDLRVEGVDLRAAVCSFTVSMCGTMGHSTCRTLEL